VNISRLLVLCAAATLWACAAQVVRYPVELDKSGSPPGKHYVATTGASLRLDSGYSRSIAAGTEFIDHGRIGQGRVLRPANGVFTVEGAHMHEAYPVVDGAYIVGFYLPVEKAFSPLSKKCTLVLEEREIK
jgi:hypothetical protein